MKTIILQVIGAIVIILAVTGIYLISRGLDEMAAGIEYGQSTSKIPCLIALGKRLSEDTGILSFEFAMVFGVSCFDNTQGKAAAYCTERHAKWPRPKDYCHNAKTALCRKAIAAMVHNYCKGIPSGVGPL